ncbi:SGNH/GDSL hydrolase family protein [Georgenia sp. SYP-B2076]|uniref:SGNH/GDSL hydrolase family protein n=1 Tax=Georgenia sp. SYP-B2076 TaxID=2495881 RepID=UPI000F8CD00F|nr:SGNH/GDSL hydrolase family protein [Georgenia sp. SYP-B2076]
MTPSDGAGPTPGRAAVPWSRFVALGDSLTEGLWDIDPAAPDRPRGWADLLAERLAERRAPHQAAQAPFEYANLAVRGRLLGEIVEEQVPAAIALGPDLVSLIGGGNDLLRPGRDPDALAARLEGAVERLRATGADVLLATGMDPSDSPVLRATRPRVATFNAHVWSIARRHGAHVLDVWGMRSLRDWRMWAQDRIHLTTAGHERVTQAALVALGLGADDDAWDDPLAALPPVARAERLRGDLVWARQYAYPWMGRRLRRRSSGDARRPKRPALAPVRPGWVTVAGEGDA